MDNKKYIILEGKKIPFLKRTRLKSGFVDDTIVLILAPELKKYYGADGVHFEGTIVVPKLDVGTIAHEVSHAVFWFISRMGVEQIEVNDPLSDEFTAYMQGFLIEKVYRKVKEWLK